MVRAIGGRKLDQAVFVNIKSLLEILRKPEYANYKKAFEKMAKKLKKKRKKPRDKHNTKIRKYFGLLSMRDWWYLVFRTEKGKGAYLFLRLIKEHDAINQPISDTQLWDYIMDTDNVDQAEEDSDVDEEPNTDPDTNEAENDIGPLPFPPPGGGW